MASKKSLKQIFKSQQVIKRYFEIISEPDEQQGSAKETVRFFFSYNLNKFLLLRCFQHNYLLFRFPFPICFQNPNKFHQGRFLMGSRKCCLKGQTSVHLELGVLKNVYYNQQSQDHKSKQNLSQTASKHPLHNHSQLSIYKSGLRRILVDTDNSIKYLYIWLGILFSRTGLV